MERKHIWFFAALAMAFAMAMGRMHSPSPKAKLHALQARWEADETGMVDGADGRMGRIDGFANEQETPAHHTVSVKAQTLGAPAKQTVKTAAQLANEKKIAANKKKKKSKKKSVSQPGQAPVFSTEPEESADLDNNENVAAKPEEQMIPAVAAQPAQKPKATNPDGTDDIPTTQAEWEALLLKNPDYKMTEKFVKYYHSNVVTEGVFFAVINKMLKDPRPQMQQLGVYSLGAAPSLKSFDALSIYTSSESAAAQPKSMAQQFIKNYGTSYLRVLGQVLQSPTVSQAAQVNALQTIRAAAELASQPPPSVDPTTSGVGPSGSVPKAQVTQLVSLLPVLKSLSESGVSDEIKSEAATLEAMIARLGQVDLNTDQPTMTAGN